MSKTYNESMETLGDRITALRKAAGLTRLDLSRGIKYAGGVPSITNWEVEGVPPRIRWLAPLADALGTTLDYLIRGDEQQLARERPYEPAAEVFGERLHRLRFESGFSKAGLGRRIGNAHGASALSRWECGAIQPALPTLVALSEALGVSLDYLLSGAVVDWPRHSAAHTDSLATRLTRLRGTVGLTRKQLIPLVGCYAHQAAGWESGALSPTLRHLPALAYALGVSLDYLITGSEYLDNTENVGTTTS